MTFHVVVTDQIFPDVDVERDLLGQAGGTLSVAVGDRETVLQAAAGADALLNTYMPLDADAIAGLTNCKIIARYGIGVDNVDLIAARERGIAVTNVPDYCVEEVATHAVALILNLLRKIDVGDQVVRSGRWGVGQLGQVDRLSALTIGLLGYGRIGRLVSRTLQSLGATVVVHDPYVDQTHDGERLVTLAELAATVDVISVHCPLTPQTRGLFDAGLLATLKPTAILVNTSRGPIVSLPDVLSALRLGRLGGAGLDVFDPEPPLTADLVGVPNLVVTPHAAFYSRQAIRESQTKAVTQVLKALRGEALDYRVN